MASFFFLPPGGDWRDDSVPRFCWLPSPPVLRCSAGKLFSFAKALRCAYDFFRYGSPVRLLTPTLYPLGMSSIILPLFGFFLLKK